MHLYNPICGFIIFLLLPLQLLLTVVFSFYSLHLLLLPIVVYLLILLVIDLFPVVDFSDICLYSSGFEISG